VVHSHPALAMLANIRLQPTAADVIMRAPRLKRRRYARTNPGASTSGPGGN